MRGGVGTVCGRNGGEFGRMMGGGSAADVV